MPRFSLNQLSEQNRVQLLAEFYDTIAALKSRDEVRLFFRDLLTPDEIAMFMRRIEVAALLKAGFTYEQISELLEVGKDKVANVQRSLQRHGEGYDIAIERLLEKRKMSIKRRTQREKSKSSSYEILKKGPYSGGLYLFGLIDEVGELLESKTDKKSKEAAREAALQTPSIRKK